VTDRPGEHRDERDQVEEHQGPVVRDKRRIDPVTGAVREPADGDSPPAPAGPVTPDSPADGLGDDVAAELSRQVAERTADLQRLQAEYANYRRRVERDRVLVVDQAAERFAGQLFPIVDDIERARDHGDLTGAFKVVADRVLGLLDGLGVEAFGAPGDAFDPSLHEAVLHDTSPEVSEPTATTVLRPGFRRGERVLRTAMVGVTDPESPAPAGAADPVAADAAADDQPGAGPAVG
jgi:molecular chaperone GrpE